MGGICTAVQGFSGTVLTAAQQNVTSLGTLSSLTVSGTASVGSSLSVTGDASITGAYYISGSPILSNTTLSSSVTSAVGIIMIGEIKMWPTSTAPSGYLLCNGSAVSRTTYSALYAVIGTTFGSGNGSTTFTLPDFRDRFPVCAGTTYSANSTGGSKDAITVSHTHTATSTVTDSGHTHNMELYSGSGTTNMSECSNYDTSFKQVGYEATSKSSTTGVTVATTNASSGSSGTNANLPPYIGIYFIMKY